MTQYSFPWDDVNGDRLYGANDFMRYFAAFLKTGVVMSFKDGLRVRSAQNGMNIQVGAGSAVISGGSYVNDETIGIQINVASSVQDRTDSIVLRMDKNARDTYLYYKPSDTTVTRNDIIFELQLAKISVKTNAVQITDADITDMRSDSTVCGWSTPFDNINVDGIVDQYKEIFEHADSDFQAWFKNLQDQLDDNQAANLQNQIDNLSTSTVKITGDQTISGKKTFTDDLDTTNLNVSETLSVNKLEISSDLPKEKLVAKPGFTVNDNAWYRVKNGMLQISCTGMSITANVPAGAWKDVCSLPNADSINTSGDTTTVIMNANNAIYVGARVRVVNGVLRILPASAIAPTQYLNDFIIMAID
ncbi:hypothetical protein RCG39_08115 [Lactococcus petauri]|uniref:hypothetical protein n=2 Tax=Lactococcus petauri TaxID=1940789 RepID=UPI0028003948|nr:hypothetical protein [Lactococcus petauri]MDQ7119174.1 hypothetical protein [Lactococcus petauri]MDQ7126953.1 hypothetical protein [Lactococcus petauri]MDQ7128854.1 hypothetical protein [Lactococcus petauri]MDQ7138694.1 hypothetical protein [Lactococcus petauri]